jgi:hypothetical protein
VDVIQSSAEVLKSAVQREMKTMPKCVDAGTYEDVIKGKSVTELSTAFPPVWDPQESGEFVVGEFLGKETIQPKGCQSFDTFNLKMSSCRGHFTRSKQEYKPELGEIISVSGEILGRALAEIEKGENVGLKFLGLGEKKGKRSAPKLFKVDKIG